MFNELILRLYFLLDWSHRGNEIGRQIHEQTEWGTRGRGCQYSLHCRSVDKLWNCSPLMQAKIEQSLTSFINIFFYHKTVDQSYLSFWVKKVFTLYLTLYIFLITLGLTPVFFMPVYVASKYSVVGYTKSVAVRSFDRGDIQYLIIETLF